VAETIMLTVAVSPSSAQVLLDGQLLPSNPFITRFPRSAATHRLRAVAAGYQAKERWVSFSDNVMLDISLVPVADPAHDRSKRAPAPAVRHTAAPQPAAQPPAVQAAPAPHRPADISPRPENDKSRRRRIEAADPYAGDQ
jgi:hypothetical protein